MLGFKHINPVHVQQMDSVVHIGEMQELGGAVAKQKVKAEHVAGFRSRASLPASKAASVSTAAAFGTWLQSNP